MDVRFDDKRVIVCGASRGIGRGIAQAFADAGARLSICARGADGIRSAAAALARDGRSVHHTPCDLGDKDATEAYVADAIAALGGVDVLVANPSGFGVTDDEAGWDLGLRVDVMGTVRAARAAIPTMAAGGGGAILYVTSISGLRASARTGPYGAVKAAVIQYAMSQAINLAPSRIRVNTIAPGSIEFPGGAWEKRRLAGDPVYNRALGAIPWGRMGRVDEVANAALFLCAPQASWITGQTLAVDGGQGLA